MFRKAAQFGYCGRFPIIPLQQRANVEEPTRRAPVLVNGLHRLRDVKAKAEYIAANRPAFEPLRDQRIPRLR